MGIKGRGQPACLRSAAASCSCLRQRGTQMHGSVRGCRLVRAPSLRITGTRGQAHLLVSRRLLLLAVLLAAESQLVGFGAAIGRRYDAAARHQCGLLHAAPHGLLASRIGLGFRGHRRLPRKKPVHERGNSTVVSRVNVACHRPRASIACLQCRSGSVCVLWSLGTQCQQSHNRAPWPRALGGGGR